MSTSDQPTNNEHQEPTPPACQPPPKQGSFYLDKPKRLGVLFLALFVLSSASQNTVAESLAVATTMTFALWGMNMLKAAIQAWNNQ